MLSKLSFSQILQDCIKNALIPKTLRLPPDKASWLGSVMMNGCNLKLFNSETRPQVYPIPIYFGPCRASSRRIRPYVTVLQVSKGLCWPTDHLLQAGCASFFSSDIKSRYPRYDTQRGPRHRSYRPQVLPGHRFSGLMYLYRFKGRGLRPRTVPCYPPVRPGHAISRPDF